MEVFETMAQFNICKDCSFPGIYAIKNLENKKIYIGSSGNIKNRLQNHFSLLKSGKHGNKNMLEDYKSGDRFQCFVISKVPLYFSYNKNKYLREFEKIAISMLNTGNPEIGYNLTDINEDISILENIINFRKEMGE